MAVKGYTAITILALAPAGISAELELVLEGADAVLEGEEVAAPELSRSFFVAGVWKILLTTMHKL